MTKKPELPDASKKGGAKKPKRMGKDFGFEGTNKTVPVPEPDAQPAEELEGTKSKFVAKSPYTRG